MNEAPGMSSEMSTSTIVTENETSFIELLIVLAKNKKRIAGTSLVFALVAFAISLSFPDIYKSTTRILPPQKSKDSVAAVISQFGAIGGMAGAELGIKNPNDTYVAMLESRTIADHLLQRFNLKQVYRVKDNTEARRHLARATQISSGKDGIIAISVEDKSAKLAADIANAYVDELYKMTQVLSVSEASQRREFFERQLKASQQSLAAAEVALKKTQESTGVVQLDGQAQAAVKAVADINAKIAAIEVQMRAMRTFATDQNPELIEKQNELIGLRAQLAKLDGNSNSNSSDAWIPIKQVPEVGLEYVRKLRDVKYYETISELLAKQYEVAKIDEAKEGSLIQVLDPAIKSEEKSRPKRGTIAVLMGLLGGFLSTCFAFFQDSYRKAYLDPRTKRRIQELKQYLRK